MSQNQSLIYSDGEIELKVSVDGESVWLNRQQIAALFSRDVKTIG
ncbi:MAG TPA: phosphoribosylaminoimidazolesuccinocarboxamide synthase, partial [Psychromonas hadalis]|nr:phosphoribosylaminoimidazolesuccinocarboxamide synthase [Psychromonas hadalis]